jgi:glucokinase
MPDKYAVAVDMGGTNIRAALVDREGRVKKKLKEPTGTEPLSVLYRLADTLCSDHEGEVCGTAVAVAGLINPRSGVVLQSPNIRSLNGLNLKSGLMERYGPAVVVENDANAAAYGEKKAGAGKELDNFVLLTLGTGIGGGIVLGGRLLPVAAEIGHISINANGAPCSCGNVGCLEVYASATAVIGHVVTELGKGALSSMKELYNGNPYKINAEDIYKAALDGDVLARTALREAGKSLGAGIASVINILSPQAVILAGGLSGAWNIYVDAAVNEAEKRTLKGLYSSVSVIPSSLGDDAGLIGAAALVFDAFGQ